MTEPINLIFVRLSQSHPETINVKNPLLTLTLEPPSSPCIEVKDNFKPLSSSNSGKYLNNLVNIDTLNTIDLIKTSYAQDEYLENKSIPRQGW